MAIIASLYCFMAIISDKKIQLIVFILAFLLYANTIGHGYTWDDSIVITENPRVKKGFSGIPSLFLKYNSDYKADKYGYRPITLTSFAIDYGLFRDSPYFGHFMNILYFAILCSVLYATLRKLFYKYSNLSSFLITILFLVHPIHVEVVANIKSRDEIFALLFSLLSLSQLIDFSKTNNLKNLFLSVLFFFLAFFSKENAITFLAIMPLALFYMQDWNNLKKLIKPIIFLASILIVCVFIVKLNVQGTLAKTASSGAGIYHENGILGNSFFHTDIFSYKIANALTILILYLKNFFYPIWQLYFYGFNQIPVANWQQPLVYVSLILHLALIIVAILKIKRTPEISFGIFFYFISIFVYTHLFITLADTMADRFLFTPSLGLCIIVVFFIGFVLKIDFQKTTLESILSASTSKNSKQLKYIFVCFLCLLGFKTYSRNKVWKDNFTLISNDMPYLDMCARAHNYYADEIKIKLKKNYDARLEREMILHYKKSFEISNDSYYAYLGLATYYGEIKKYQDEIAILNTMIRIYPNQADPNFYLGQAFYYTDEIKKSVLYLEKSLQLAPEVLSTYYFLSLAYSRAAQYDKAIASIQKAKEKFSESVSIYEALGTIYFDMGNMDESTKSTFEMLKYGANPEMIYGIIIGRYQSKKMDKEASFYYKQGLANGVFKKSSH